MKSKPEDVAAGKVLRKLRTELGLTQAEIGQRIGVSYQQFQKYETGANRMSVSALFAIASAIGVVPSVFVRAIEVEIEGAKENLATNPDLKVVDPRS